VTNALRTDATDDEAAGCPATGSCDDGSASLQTPAVHWQVIAESDTLRLMNAPTTDYTDGLQVKVALKPTFSATQAGQVFLEEFGEGIAFGAAARLHDQVGKPWASVEKAVYMRSQFRRCCARARKAIFHGFMNQPVMVEIPDYV